LSQQISLKQISAMRLTSNAEGSKYMRF
jgi:hypothetical protein